MGNKKCLIALVLEEKALHLCISNKQLKVLIRTLEAN